MNLKRILNLLWLGAWFIAGLSAVESKFGGEYAVLYCFTVFPAFLYHFEKIMAVMQSSDGSLARRVRPVGPRPCWRRPTPPAGRLSLSSKDTRDFGDRGVARAVKRLGALLPSRLALLQNHAAHNYQNFFEVVLFIQTVTNRQRRHHILGGFILTIGGLVGYSVSGLIMTEYKLSYTTLIGVAVAFCLHLIFDKLIKQVSSVSE